MRKGYNEHYAVDLPYNHKESNAERNERRKRDRAILKEGGVTLPIYYKYWTTDHEAVKAEYKASADKKAAELEKQFGIQLSVCKGTFL